MCSTTGNLKRSISCQEEKCVISWSCGMNPAATATDSNSSRHHQTQMNYRSPFAHGRRSHPAKIARASTSEEELADISSVNAKLKHREDDFDCKTEAQQEHKHEECHEPTEMPNSCDIGLVEISVQSYDIPVDSCCRHPEYNTGTETVSDNIAESRTTIDTLGCCRQAELQSNTGTETVSDNIEESRTTIDTLVPIVSPAEYDDATDVSVDIVVLPTDVSCDINEDVLGTGTDFGISMQQLSRTAVEETDPPNSNSEADRPFEDASWCIHNGDISTKFTRQDLDDRLSVTKRRGRHKGRSQRMGRKWKPIAEDVVQLDFQMSLFPRNVSAEVDVDNSAVIAKELENFERSLDCPDDADGKSSTENGSGITADPKQSEGRDNDIQNCGVNLDNPEQKSSQDTSLRTMSTSTKDDIFDCEDDDDFISFYGDKIPHFSRASLGRPNEPYLPECQKLRMKKKWKKTKARIQVKTKHCRTVNNTVHGQPIYVNFRVMLRMHMELRSAYSNPCYHTLSLKKIDKFKGKSVDGVESTKGNGNGARRKERSRPPVSSLFAMDAYNADSDLSADLVNVLVNLQHRDLLPEDYELLLRLDERVAQKTIDSSVLSTLKTEVVGPEGRAELCAICMEPYEAGHTMKYLPCGHCYHDTCIDRWLSNSSQNCPLDGVPIDDAL